MEWQDSKPVKKGKYGETIIDEYIKKSTKLIPYQPVYEGEHPFDRFLASPDKRNLFILEVKVKAKRNYYPDTGFDLKNYKEYQYLKKKYGIKIFICFVDEDEKKIYGHWLEHLKKPRIENGKKYPSTEVSHNGDIIIYFPRSVMKDIAKIKEKDVQELRKLNTRNYSYLHHL